MENQNRSYNWNGKTLLIVEDDFSSYIFLEEILHATGALLIHADNGEKSVHLCINNPNIDMVLMDVRLPGIDGLEATRRIKAARPGLPVIAQTANAFDEDRVSCRDAGCDAFISKPIATDKLLELIHLHLFNHR
jgi:CheY-like chemotaxis protein